MDAIDIGQGDAHDEGAEEGVQAEIFRTRRAQKCEQGDARDRARRLGQIAMHPLHQPWQHEVAEQQNAADEDEHHAEDRHPLALTGRVGTKLGENHREQSPAHEIVHEGCRHDRPADLALEEPHVHEDPGDHGVG